MATGQAAKAENKKPVEVDDDENSIDEEQLEEYREEVENLGSFPDKVKISSLTMIAGDHAESRPAASAIYQIIRQRLLTTSRDNMLPLVYVLDSILKNVKGFYIDLVQEDAAKWMPKVYQKLQDAQRAKLKKVWKIWDESKIFSSEAWKAMGQCFDNQSFSGKTNVGSNLTTVAGITRTTDGKLLLSAVLRTEMQNILDDLQKDMTNELDKVSLERLADINQDLLANIKKAAEDNLRTSTGALAGTNSADAFNNNAQQLPSFFTETRSPEALRRAKAWHELSWDPLSKSHEIISKLQHAVIQGTSSSERYTEREAFHMIQCLAAVSATSSVLTAAVEQLKNQVDRKEHKKGLSFPGSDSATVGAGGSSLVDKKDFTNDGLQKKNTAVIGMLYELGLPFQSSGDGRRFRTEIELSNHLDALFKRNQAERSITRTEERGWYVQERTWTGEERERQIAMDVKDGGQQEGTVDEFDPVRSTMPADETRDRCVICGINFKMLFDNDDGIYKYSNCREIEVLGQDVGEKDSQEMLVHVTCWRGLGSPEVLTTDQALQDTIRS